MPRTAEKTQKNLQTLLPIVAQRLTTRNGHELESDMTDSLLEVDTVFVGFQRRSIRPACHLVSVCARMNAQQKKYDDSENDLKCTFTCDPPQRQSTREINNQEHDANRDEHQRPQPNERQVTIDVE